jgi:hypothetical protein
VTTKFKKLLARIDAAAKADDWDRAKDIVMFYFDAIYDRSAKAHRELNNLPL